MKVCDSIGRHNTYIINKNDCFIYCYRHFYKTSACVSSHVNIVQWMHNKKYSYPFTVPMVWKDILTIATFVTPI